MQVTRRAYECLFVDRILANSKMHILHHIIGVTFYLPICLSTFIEGIGNLGKKLSKFNLNLLVPSIYSIPKGDWFVYVSSHYFAETLIYISFVILNKG
ncbi:hypothetical protein Glove_227g142 [Diversispora epigaea]|uniref:Uncharacterized protein n=1 Tax=Diversispora epigaea TaxID=1348612 RepID=A0A397IE47_9GLOM|nr:hypothetical protein Glove_227g142 [Diversispora epigaea]